jgi:hypothetical protein
MKGLFASLTLFAAVLICQARDEEDPIAADLKTAQETYRATVEKLNQTVLAAFDAQAKKLESNTTLKVDKQVMLIDQLKKERKAFERNVLPPSVSMKDAVADYRFKLAAARALCEKAFDTAAEKYRAKKDLDGAKAVLAAKQAFILDTFPFSFEGVWQIHHSSRWSAKRTVKLDKVFDYDGTECTWERKKGELTVTWPGGDGWERLQMDPKNVNKLVGKTNAGLDTVWDRVMTK